MVALKQHINFPTGISQEIIKENMLQEIKTLRDFITDPQEQFKFMPLQLENCLLFSQYEKGEDGISKRVVYVFDSGTCFIGKIENPHYIPSRNK